MGSWADQDGMALPAILAVSCTSVERTSRGGFGLAFGAFWPRGGLSRGDRRNWRHEKSMERMELTALAWDACFLGWHGDLLCMNHEFKSSSHCRLLSRNHRPSVATGTMETQHSGTRNKIIPGGPPCKNEQKAPEARERGNGWPVCAGAAGIPLSKSGHQPPGDDQLIS